jgi:hypothetical protein
VASTLLELFMACSKDAGRFAAMNNVVTLRFNARARQTATLTALLLILLFAAAPSAHPQGTVYFNNKVSSAGINAPVYDTVMGGAKLEGSDYKAQLYAGPAGTTEDKLVAVGAIVDFLTGVAAGYLNVGTDGSRSIPGVTPGDNAVVQIRAWRAAAGATYEEALASPLPGAKAGKSNLVTVQTPPSALMTPANLVGLQSFAVVAVPEPTMLALSALGVAWLLFRFRK